MTAYDKKSKTGTVESVGLLGLVAGKALIDRGIICPRCETFSSNFKKTFPSHMANEENLAFSWLGG